jgi:hypothetical protein
VSGWRVERRLPCAARLPDGDIGAAQQQLKELQGSLLATATVLSESASPGQPGDDIIEIREEYDEAHASSPPRPPPPDGQAAVRWGPHVQMPARLAFLNGDVIVNP